MAKNKGMRHREGTIDGHPNPWPERTIKLGWGSISKTRQDFLDTNCVLSLLCFQPGGDVLEDEDVEQTQISEATDNTSDSDDEANDLWDSETTARHEKEKSLMVEACLRNRFLDRLAEVLARAKKRLKAVK